MGRDVWMTQALKQRQKAEPLLSALETAMKEKPMHLDLVTISGTGDA